MTSLKERRIVSFSPFTRNIVNDDTIVYIVKFFADDNERRQDGIAKKERPHTDVLNITMKQLFFKIWC